MGEITFNLGFAKSKLVGLIEKWTYSIDKTRVVIVTCEKQVHANKLYYSIIKIL